MENIIFSTLEDLEKFVKALQDRDTETIIENVKIWADAYTESPEYKYPLPDELRESYVIHSHKGQVWYNGNLLHAYEDLDRKVFGRIRFHMAFEQTYPNVYEINDHGNITLLDYYGNEQASWV